ncbi:protein-glucosylgalactosylhydroxylysine glucosidase-like [Clavelina lepadiformis]|uniref:protein-glucosylgalactosylhydroxylysine glucosidase-like n=1 Tax=Clavelina lepadiformis TaxID=159417 RepID=UPI0040416992
MLQLKGLFFLVLTINIDFLITALKAESNSPKLLKRRIPTDTNEDSSKRLSVLISNKLPNDTRFYPTVSNSFVGHQIFSDTIYINGLYNGRKKDSHRARIPNFLPYVITPTSSKKFSTKYMQDLDRGVFSAQAHSDSLQIEQVFYAHKLFTRLLVTEITITVSAYGFYDVAVQNMTAKLSADIKFRKSKLFKCKTPSDAQHQISNDILLASYCSGKTLIPEEDSSPRLPIHIAKTIFPRNLKMNVTSGSLPVTKRWVFIMSVAPDRREAKYYYKKGCIAAKRGILQKFHEDKWTAIWNHGDIRIKSNSSLGLLVKSSLYYLISAFPIFTKEYPFQFFGASPGGLTNGGAGKYYYGHVFWDQDFWMVPALLPIFPDTAQAVLRYRVQRLLPAYVKARSLGYSGAAYPWESAYTGCDVCEGAAYIKEEIHITGDIVHLLKQYMLLNGGHGLTEVAITKLESCEKGKKNANSRRFFSINQQQQEPCVTLPDIYSCTEITDEIQCLYATGWDMVREIAFFWQSRMEWSHKRGGYVINGVMGPDEWHHPVNNSAYTNAIAARSLKFAADLARYLGACPKLSSQWDEISSSIVIPFDEERQYHPEYDGFDPSKNVVKQADTIMLGFPLMEDMPRQVRLNDLLIHRNATTSFGPAMTWGMFAINWLDVGEQERARSDFLRQLANIQPPFNIWSENPDGTGAVNFLTGMGGFIQSIVYGYFGLRVHDNHLSVNPVMLPESNSTDVEEMTLHGLVYRGLFFDFRVTELEINVKLVGIDKPYLTYPCAQIRSVSASHRLCNAGDEATFARGKLELSLES